jgi:thiosulfate/3-mercaptopyruvate sulfurtransferase
MRIVVLSNFALLNHFMKRILFIGITFLAAHTTIAQTWKKEHLMPTADLAAKITAPAGDKPVIFNVGPMDNIKTARFVGRGTSVTAIDKMKSELSMENKNKTIVLYCGCCSFASCPNIKPAFDALISAGYKNTKVLEIPEGIKPDWVAKGYPME